MKRFFAFLALLLLASGLPAANVRVASWNVRNYNGADRRTESGWTPSAPKDEDEKEALRHAILAAKPDVILFQEMGPEAYLTELQRDLAKEGADYPYSAHLTAADKDRCLAALSKIPFKSVEKVENLTYTLAGQVMLVRRGLLVLHFETRGTPWTLFDFHVKSRERDKLGEAATNRERLSEAECLRGAILARSGLGDKWLAAGDVNDPAGGAVWRRLTRVQKEAIGTDLRPKDSRGEYWTYYYSKNDTYQRIDLMLASEPMLTSVKRNSALIFDGTGCAASDHRMCMVDLTFPDAGADALQKAPAKDKPAIENGEEE